LRSRRKFLTNQNERYRKSNIQACYRHEMELFERLKDRFGFQILRQFRIGFYFFDLLLINRMLLIEVDGSTHDSEKQKERDKEKEELAKRMGFNILRVKNDEVFSAIDSILNKIDEMPVLENYSQIFEKTKHRILGHFDAVVDIRARKSLRRRKINDPIQKENEKMDKFGTQVRARRCMEIIVEMKERMPKVLAADFMRGAFWECHKAINLNSVGTTTAIFEEQLAKLVARFEAADPKTIN
jgi:very-short-patch-repair endonuclease